MPADLLTLGNYRGRIVAHGSSTGHTFGLCSTLVPLLLKVCLSRAASVIVPQNVRKERERQRLHQSSNKLCYHQAGENP